MEEEGVTSDESDTVAQEEVLLKEEEPREEQQEAHQEEGGGGKEEVAAVGPRGRFTLLLASLKVFVHQRDKIMLFCKVFFVLLALVIIVQSR